jgi:hypothetical protein
MSVAVLLRWIEGHVDDLESLVPLAPYVSGVGALAGLRQLHAVGEGREQGTRPQPPLGHDIDLDREHGHDGE